MTSLQFTDLVKPYSTPDKVCNNRTAITAYEDERGIALSYNKKSETFSLRVGNAHSLPQRNIEATLYALYDYAVEQEHYYKLVQKTIEEIR